MDITSHHLKNKAVRYLELEGGPMRIVWLSQLFVETGEGNHLIKTG